MAQAPLHVATPPNTVTIACDAGQIQTIVSVAGSFVADPKPKTQPTINISPNKGNTLWTISFDYDRDGSSTVATDYVSECGNRSHVFSPKVNNADSPEKLNFFFEVTINFNAPGAIVPVNVYLAQGHRKDWGSVNNWWIGGFQVADNGPYKAILVVPSTPINVFEIDGEISNLTLTQWS